MMPVSPELLAKLIEIESGGNPRAINPTTGAAGATQIMPDTARQPGYGVQPISDPLDPRQAVPFGQQYLASMLQKYGGNVEHALAAYNAGPGRVDSALQAGRAPIGLDYARNVLSAAPGPRSLSLVRQFADNTLVGDSGKDQLATKLTFPGRQEPTADEIAPQVAVTDATAATKLVFPGSMGAPEQAAAPAPSQSVATHGPQQEKPGVTSLNDNPYWRAYLRFGHGIESAGLGVTQGILNHASQISEALGGPNLSDQFNADLKKRNDDYQSWRQQHGAQKGETDLAGIAGQAAPYLAAPSGLAGTVATAGLAGMTTPQEDGDYSVIKAAVNAAEAGATAATVHGILNVAGRAFGWGVPQIEKARDLVRKTLKRNGMDLEQSIGEARKAITETPAKTLAEVGSTTKIPQALVAMPGESREIARKLFDERAYDAPNRVVAEAKKALGAPRSAADLNALMEKAKTAAGPLYDEAYQMPITFTHELEKLLNTPDGKDALRIAARELKNRGEDRLGQYFIDIAENGTATIKEVPGMQAWDFIKRGFDRLSNIAKRATGEDALRWDKVGVDRMRRQLRDELVRQTTKVENGVERSPYAEALNAWSGPVGVQRAIDLGKDALKQLPDEVAEQFGKLNPVEQAAYRVGVVQAIKDAAGSRESGGMLSAKLRNSPNMREIFAIVGPTPEAGAKVPASFANEVGMKRSANEIMSGSQTAERAATMADLKSSHSLDFAGDLAAAKTGSPWAITRIANRLTEFATRPGREAVRDKAGRMLFSGDQAEKMRILDELLRQRELGNYARITAPVSTASGVAMQQAVPLANALSSGGNR